MKTFAVIAALCLGYVVISLTPVLVRAVERKIAPSDGFFTVSQAEVVGDEKILVEWELLNTDSAPAVPNLERSEVHVRASLTSKSKRSLLLNWIRCVGVNKGIELFRLTVFDGSSTEKKVVLYPGQTVRLQAVGPVMTGLVVSEDLVSSVKTEISYTPMGDARGEGGEKVGKEQIFFSSRNP